jgi:hypothetical protein
MDEAFRDRGQKVDSVDGFPRKEVVAMAKSVRILPAV